MIPLGIRTDSTQRYVRYLRSSGVPTLVPTSCLETLLGIASSPRSAASADLGYPLSTRNPGTVNPGTVCSKPNSCAEPLRIRPRIPEAPSVAEGQLPLSNDSALTSNLPGRVTDFALPRRYVWPESVRSRPSRRCCGQPSGFGREREPRARVFAPPFRASSRLLRQAGRSCATAIQAWTQVGAPR